MQRDRANHRCVSVEPVELNGPSGADTPDRPALAPRVQLLGELTETGYVEPQWLIQRDQRFIQVAELLYRVAEQLDGRRTVEEVADRVSQTSPWAVQPEHVCEIIRSKLRPLGLLATTEGSVPRIHRARSALQITLRRTIIPFGVLDTIASVLQVLYRPMILAAFLLTIAIVHGWVYFVHGVAQAARAALFTPGGLLLVLSMAVPAALFHELGHAAALRYGGGHARRIGVGLYLVYPTFYTDVSDAYRLDRWSRLRVDLGGIYFHLVFATGIVALYPLSGNDILLAVVLVIYIDVLYQCLPHVRLDGYWALADLIGIPDVFSHVAPLLRSVLPGARRDRSSALQLKRWVKRVLVVYTLLTVPVLALFFTLTVKTFPRFVALGWDALRQQAGLLWSASDRGDAITAMAAASQAVLLALSLLAVVAMLYSGIRPLLNALRTWSSVSLPRRLASALTVTSAAAVLAFLWAPEFLIARNPLPVGTLTFEVNERSHAETPVTYAQTPPVGGPHAPVWQNCGFYSRAVAAENAVHSLEHGAVWITYRPDLSREAVGALRRLARRHTYLLVSPLAEPPAAVVASAWGSQLHLESVDDPRLHQFIRRFRLGPEAPERGGPCTGGVGAPDR